jgi:predicted ATPase
VQAALETWCLGQPDLARARYEQGLALARRLGHPQIVLHALARGLPLFQLCRDRERLEVQAQATFDLATEQDSANFRTEAQFMGAWVLSGRGEDEHAVRLMHDSLRERQAFAKTWTNPYYFSLLVRVQARAGALDQALATLEVALEQARTSGDAWVDPDLFRIQGDLVLALGHDSAKAEECFRTSLAQARTRLARGWELRSATSLARLWARQGRGDEARALLAPVYGAFDEGFGTPDLQEAKALLDGLASAPEAAGKTVHHRVS